MAAADLRRDLGAGAHDSAMRSYADARTGKLRQGYFFQRGLSGQELPGLLGRLISGEVDYLDVAARNAWRCNTYARNIYTVLDPDKDRVYPWARYLLPWIYGGGNALNQRAGGPYPTINVSWVDSGYDFAALVHSADRRHLRLTAYNFVGAREVGMRVWRMDPGIYEVQFRPRGGRAQRRRLALHRGEELRLDLPARSSVEVELKLAVAGDWSAERPDLALSKREGATSEGNRISVIVHNIGSVPSPSCKAALMRGERRIAEASIPAIAAPLDFSPRTATVSFVVPDAVRGELRVIVDSDDEVAEITELNNTLATVR